MMSMRVLITGLIVAVTMQACSLVPEKVRTSEDLMRDPTHTTVNIATQVVDQMEISLAMQPARHLRLYDEMGAVDVDPTKRMQAGETMIGWRAVIRDPYNGQVIPYGDIVLEVTSAGAAPFDFKLLPLIDGAGIQYIHIDGLPDDGDYVVNITVQPPELARIGPYADIWQYEITTSFSFQMTNGLIFADESEGLMELPPLAMSDEEAPFRDVAGDSTFEEMGVRVVITDADTILIPEMGEWISNQPEVGDYLIKVELTDQLVSNGPIPYGKIDLMVAPRGAEVSQDLQLAPMWGPDGFAYGALVGMEEGEYVIQADVAKPNLGREFLSAQTYTMPVQARFGHDFVPPVVFAQIDEPAPVEVMISAFESFYTVQAGAFNKPGFASSRRGVVETAGYRVYIDEMTLDDGSLATRVKVGPYGTRDEADANVAPVTELIGEQAFVVAMCGRDEEVKAAYYDLHVSGLDEAGQETFQQGLMDKGWEGEIQMVDGENVVSIGSYETIWKAISNAYQIRRQLKTLPQIVPFCTEN